MGLFSGIEIELSRSRNLIGSNSLGAASEMQGWLSGTSARPRVGQQKLLSRLLRCTILAQSILPNMIGRALRSLSETLKRCTQGFNRVARLHCEVSAEFFVIVTQNEFH